MGNQRAPISSDDMVTEFYYDMILLSICLQFSYEFNNEVFRPLLLCTTINESLQLGRGNELLVSLPRSDMM